MASKLYIIGTSLDEESLLSPEAILKLKGCHLIIAEQKKVFEKQAKRSGLSLEGKTVIYLDNLNDFSEIKSHFHKAKDSEAALLSDHGMPVLFDPGKEVLDLARQAKWEVRTVPSATSWGSAACLSGFSPPFLLEGFLPQEREARKRRLVELKKLVGHKILMETPYRFNSLLQEIGESQGSTTPIFLAWEMATPHEFFFWGELKELVLITQKRGMKKGEFVLILEDDKIR